jgi:RNA 3'-terminal phosphate cyclase (ATP)
MLVIDGSMGEGGGQVLRTSLALALVTGQPFRMHSIRARRSKPGLLHQHLTAVRAAAAVGGADVHGDALGSSSLVFAPGRMVPGRHEFDVGTAGSATLVLQAILPALLAASEPSTVTVAGGTHNPHAPPCDFLAQSFLPLLGRMGPRVEAKLERYGFFPAGGGRVTVRVEPAGRLVPLDVLERGALRARRARALLASLPRSIAERELAMVGGHPGWEEAERAAIEVPARGPGNVLLLEFECEGLTLVVTGFGELGVRAEAVAAQALEAADRWLESQAAADEHLADQLLVPLAVAGGSFTAPAPLSRHAVTNLEVLRRFVDVDAEVVPAGPGSLCVRVQPRRPPPA